MRLKLRPSPFGEGASFRQELKLSEGYVEISAKNGNLNETKINVWVDVFKPVVHISVKSKTPVITEASYESWRTADRLLNEKELFACPGYRNNNMKVTTFKDDVAFEKNDVMFYHRNRNESLIFDFTVKHEGLDSIKSQLWNPQKDLVYGGLMSGENMRPKGTSTGKYQNTGFTASTIRSIKATQTQELKVYLHIDTSANLSRWRAGLRQLVDDEKTSGKTAWPKTKAWWKQFWERSFIRVNPLNSDTSNLPWQVGRNYQLFRYMLGCNAYGSYPTKFNGGLFTYDPVFVNADYPFTPDHRNWGGGVFTAQNQRLVYWPMLKSGDFDMMRPQFNFYQRLLNNAELRTRFYWGHPGASFTEQMENFGLPSASEYGWKRPPGYNAGTEFNPWLEYLWDTVLEFCLMILDSERFSGEDITSYMPLIESCVRFFDEHYRYLASLRSSRTLDENGHLVLYPGSSAETYKVCYNSATTVAGLTTVLSRMLELPEKYLSKEKSVQVRGLLSRIPPLSFRYMEGHQTIAPAKSWERINNTESPQLYPVFPYGLFGVGKPGIEIALNTWLYDSTVLKHKSHVGWKQDNIFSARLGLAEEAAALTTLKLKDSERRFPAFWGPGFDWTPDHNWGGSGMIGLQEMLLQTDGKKILAFPAWPRNWDVHFRLHAPYNTTVEASLKNGKVEFITVIPAAREKDVIMMLK